MEQAFLYQNPELRTSQKILLAVSTGVDSMVLLHLLEKMGSSIGVAHIDHQLREESKAEAAFLEQYCKEHNIPFYLKVWQTPTKKNMEAKARKLRYEFFSTIMEREGYNLLLTAHHGDDQVETLLMRLVRGGSFAGHAGISRVQPFATGKLIRPLLTFSKEQIYAYANEQHLTYFEDATNHSTDDFRNRIRLNVVPELKKENPQLLEHANQFHQQLTWADQLIQKSLKENLNNVATDGTCWSFTQSVLPVETGERYYFLTTLFQQITEAQELVVSQRQLFSLLEQLEKVSSQWRFDLGDAWHFVRRYDTYFIEKKVEITDQEKYSLNENEHCQLSDGSIISVRKNSQYKPSEGFQILLPVTVKFPLIIRHRKAGDRIRLTQDLTKRVNRYFIDKKIPTAERDAAWIVEDASGEILAILSFVNSYLSITTETDRIHYILDYTLNKAN